MDLNFKPVLAEDIQKILPFFGLRPDKTCESVFLDSFSAEEAEAVTGDNASIAARITEIILLFMIFSSFLRQPVVPPKLQI